MKIILTIFCLFFINNSYAQYWAKIDYSKLSINEITIFNISKEPLRCQLRVLNQKAFFEIEIKGHQIMEFKEKLRMHNISLYCKPIEKITRIKPWILNPYVNQKRPYISIFK